VINSTLGSILIGVITFVGSVTGIFYTANLRRRLNLTVGHLIMAFSLATCALCSAYNYSWGVLSFLVIFKLAY